MSTTLPHGIIQINEGNIAWYGDITANWQLIDSKIGEYDAAVASIPAPANNGTLTINYAGAIIAMFGADDAGNVSADIPAPGDGTLTIKVNGSTAGTFTANASTNATANIQCVDLSSAQTIAGNKEFTGTTTAHDLAPSATDTYNFGSPSVQWNNAYIKSLTINGVVCGDILTHNVSEFVDVSSNQTIGGTKTFSALRTYFGRDISCYSFRKYGKNLNPTSNTYQYINFSGNTVSDGSTNDWSSGYLEQVVNTNGSTRGRWFIQDTSENAASVELWANGSDKQFRPQWNGVVGLGSTTNKWKSIYSNTYYLGNTAFGNIVTHNASEFVLVSDLATVATSGSYNDLSNKPTIPTVNDATLTIQLNGADIGTFSANQETNETINIVVPDALPTGSYIHFAGSQAPEGFLVCNGGEISRTTYSALFAVIGTTYGSGDGSTTFNLPNLTDRFLQGSTTSGTVKNAGLPNITGELSAAPRYGGDTRSDTVYVRSGAFSFAGSESWASDLSTESANTYNWHRIKLNASSSSSIYGNSSTVQPPALTCLICIKY